MYTSPTVRVSLGLPVSPQPKVQQRLSHCPPTTNQKILTQLPKPIHPWQPEGIVVRKIPGDQIIAISEISDAIVTE